MVGFILQGEQNYDTVYVELTTTGNKKLMVAIVYRPPKQLRTDNTALYEEIQSTHYSKEKRRNCWEL